MKASALGIILLLSISPALSAQTAKPSLTGAVTAPAGTPIPNARVSARNLATGQSSETETDYAGIYQFENLIPGEYEFRSMPSAFLITQ